MRLFKFLCAATVFLLVACSPEFKYEVVPSDSVELSKNQVRFSSGTGSEIIGVEASGTVKTVVDTSAKWLTAEIVEEGIAINALANEEIFSRSGRIVVSSGNCAVDINVVQAGMDVNFVPSADTLKFSNLKASDKVEITSNLAWTVIPGANWITPSVYEGSKNASITVEVPDNISLAGRISTLDFYNGDERVGRVVITQEPVVPEMNFSAETVSGGNSEFSETLTVSANWPWNVEMSKADSTWITLTSPERNADGLVPAGENYKVGVAVSETLPSRDGVLLFTCGGVAFNVPVHQEGVATTLSVSQNSFSVPAAASPQKLTVTTNNIWEIKDVPAWISLSKTNGTPGTYEIEFTASKREGSPRSASFSVVAGDKQQTVVVNQAAGAWRLYMGCPFVDEKDPSKGFGKFVAPFVTNLQGSGAKAYNLGKVQGVLKEDNSVVFEFYSSHGAVTQNGTSGFRLRDNYNKEAESWPFKYNHDPALTDKGEWQPDSKFGINPDSKVFREVTVDDTGKIIGDEDFAYIKFPAIEGLKLTKIESWPYSTTANSTIFVTTDVSVSNADAAGKAVSDSHPLTKMTKVEWVIRDSQENTSYYLFVKGGALHCFYNLILYYE